MKMKRWLPLVAAVLLAAGFAFSAAGEETETPPVDMEVSCLYGNVGRLGSDIPILVRLYGQSTAEFNGAVTVSTLESRGERESETYEYEFPVTVQPGETGTYVYYVPLGQKSDEFYVALRDEKGRTAAGNTVQIEVSRDSGNLLIGVLDDRDGELSYLDNVSLSYGLVRSKLLPIDPVMFPDDPRGLDLLDMMIVNDCRTADLTADQQDALLRWVEDGGVLLFGTGSRVSDTLGPFAEGLVEIPYKAPQLRTVNMGVEYARLNPDDSSLSLVCADLSVPGGDEVLISDELPLLTTVTRGKGKIGIFPFDLGDLGAFAEKNPSYALSVFTAVLGEDKIQNLYFYSSYSDDEEYWNAQNLVNTGSADRLPKLGLYTAVIICYILIAGPGIYLFLKKKGQRRYYGPAVILFSLASAAVVYLMGAGTRFRSEFFTCAAIRDVSGEAVSETVYLNIRTPDSRPYSVAIRPEYTVSPITKSARYDNMPMGAPEEKDGAVTLRFDGDATKVSARKSRAFEPRFFRLDKKTENGNHAGIEAEVSYFNGKLTGSVTNRFPFRLEKTALYLYGQAVEIGDLDPWETKVLDGAPILTYPVDMTYVLADTFSGGSRFETADVGDGEYLLAAERSNLLSFFIRRYFETCTPVARIAAFGPDEDMDAVFADEKKTVDGMALYTSEVSLNMREGDTVYRNALMHRPKAPTGSENQYSSFTTVYGSEAMVLEYSLGSDIEVERLSFVPVSDGFLDSKKYYYVKRFTGAAYFYNYNTKAYDRADLEKGTFTREELLPYLSPSNSLTIKYVGDGTEAAGTSASLPLMMVTGRER